MVKPVRKSSSKNPPILSHEFVIQNHADIVSCVAMVFVIGIMVQATAPVASTFIAMQHNVTGPGEFPVLYRPGVLDWCAVLFYTLICVVVHAILQEYVLDKVSKRLHLSKSKVSVVSSSGQLAAFYLMSVAWGCHIVLTEGYVPDVSLLWLDYPAPLSFMLKLYLVVQLSYTLHQLPEIYFQRVKRDEQVGRALGAVAGLALVAVPYFLNLNRLLVCLLVLHHASELLQEAARLLQVVDREERLGGPLALASSAVLVLARLASIILSVLTLWYGLALQSRDAIDFAAGDFNVAAVRLAVLAAVCVLQAYLMFNFTTQQLARVRETRRAHAVAASKGAKKKDRLRKGKRESDLPEVDQNHHEAKVSGAAAAPVPALKHRTKAK